MCPSVALCWQLPILISWFPHSISGQLSDTHNWLYIVSDLSIWLAYTAIPILLIRFVLRKTGLPLAGVFWLFGAFILLCGLTHLTNALSFWWPAHYINVSLHIITAVVSIITTVALFRYFSEALALHTSQEYRQELDMHQQALHELAHSNQELKQFVHVASHDLQSPLKTITNYLALLETRHGIQLDSDARKLIGVTTEAAKRMQALIRDLLVFSSVGFHEAHTQVDLNKLLTEVLAEQQANIKESGATIDIGPLPSLVIHPTNLYQIFQNLISNSLKYCRADTAPQITIRAVDERNLIRFAVRDNGIGIAQQHYERVFQIFQRLHGRNVYPGTGIGLATVRKVVDLYGGQVWIDSTVGVGTTVFFTIPKPIKSVQYHEQTHSMRSAS